MTAPTIAQPGQTMNVGWTVANNGLDKTATTHWSDAIYLSSDAAFDANQSRLLATLGHYGALDLGLSYTQNVSILLPLDVPPANVLLAVVNWLVVE